MAVTLGETDKPIVKELHHLVSKTSIVMKKKQADDGSRTHYKKYLIGSEAHQPLCAIRKFCSGINLPLLRLERKSLHLTMTNNMNNNTFNVCQTEYGRKDSNLHWI